VCGIGARWSLHTTIEATLVLNFLNLKLEQMRGGAIGKLDFVFIEEGSKGVELYV